MKFWFINEGQKEGPLEDYELREKIRGGEISRDTKVWHEGASDWVKAADVSLLASEFEIEEAKIPPVVVEITPFLGWRRFGARWFDFLLYQLAILIIFKIGGMPFLPDPDSQQSGMTVIGLLIPAIIMEGALLSSLGYTPGKWLMALKVTDYQGKVLGTGSAIMRSLRVWVLGMGMKNPLLLLLGHLITLWLVKKRGAPFWDLTTGFRVPGKTLTTARLTMFWVFSTILFVTFFGILWPELQPLVEAEMARQGK